MKINISHSPLLVLMLSLWCAAASMPAVELGVQLVADLKKGGGQHSITGITHAPGDSTRLFVLEQKTGKVRIIKNGKLLEKPFLDLNADGRTVGTGYEDGLLGLAFHPNYQKNGQFFVRYVEPESQAWTHHLVRYQVSRNPDLADTSSDHDLFTHPNPAFNHNGGWVEFGPDGYLYTSFGDGGKAPRESQGTNNLFGSIIRIDVGAEFVDRDSPPFYGIPKDNPRLVGRDSDGHSAELRPEIYHFGFRNPWQCAFDPETGDLWVGDVGGGRHEEISFAPSGTKGLNFGWPAKEGKHLKNKRWESRYGPFVDPVRDFVRTEAACITGGRVYRGRAIPELQGWYLCGDFVMAQYWGLRADKSGLTDEISLTASLGQVTTPQCFGEDAAGELYIGTRTGQVFKIIAADK